MTYMRAVPIVVATPFPMCDALYVGTAGNATLQVAGATGVAFTGLQAGTIYPVPITNVTTATASNMLALYYSP